ncbi:MAG: hypothetical protein ACREX3_23490 [Gammaproteobacteria bacterium]
MKVGCVDFRLSASTVAAGLVISLVAINVPASQAHFDTSGKYSHSDSACTSSSNRVDPVMNVFYNNATDSNVGTHIQHHTGWQNQSGSLQWYKIHANPTVCGRNASSAQRASACGSCDRVHIRFKRTYHGDATWGTTSLGTPHNEDWKTGGGCFPGKHAVYDPYGFQDGRTLIYNNLVAAGGHTFAGSANWGNTALMPQCDGNSVNSLDGKVDYIRMPG